jgi:hypothetical protein
MEKDVERLSEDRLGLPFDLMAIKIKIAVKICISRQPFLKGKRDGEQ